MPDGALADLIRHFSALLDPVDGNATLPSTWIASAQAENLPHRHAFTRSLEKAAPQSTPPSPCRTTTAAPKE